MTYLPSATGGGMGPQGPQGPEGPEGPQGLQGATPPDTVSTTPPAGDFPVTGLHVDAGTGTLHVDYDDTPAP